ncbi:MAG TPA: M14 family zinc carboxypeptidase, partial [Caldilineaceae bacterium]|nr:M14 family zinc carboxypeptidase [Caldilineaceae bacterium]
MHRLPRLLLLALLVLIGAGWSSLTGLAQSAPPSPSAYRIYFGDQAGLAALAGELDIWRVDHADGYLVAPLAPDQLARVRAVYQVEPEPAPLLFPVHPAAQQQGIPGFACYRTVEETSATLAALAAQYPNLARLQTIGASWDKTQPDGPPGYDLEVLILTNQATPGPKFRFFLMGAVHARELTTAETATRFAESLLAGYGVDPDATWLLDYGELHVLPMANPDGRKKAEAGQLWRKNTNNVTAACSFQNTASTYGVDLNRNSSFQWNSCPGCSSSDSCSLTYRGTAPASEPETQAIEGYMASIFADRRGLELTDAAPADTQGLMVSLHSYSEYVLFPWGFTADEAPNGPALQTLGRKFGYYLNYSACQSGAAGCFYPTDGTHDDWAYGVLGIPAYTFELGAWFFEDCNFFEQQILADALAALRYGFKAARAPYQIPAGPEVVNLAVTSPTVAAGQLITLTALADDTRSYGGSYGSDAAQPIAAVQMTLDAPPWQPGVTPHLLIPTDGAFDAPQEAVHLPINTACWPAGRHTLFVQAQDSAGNWGTTSAHFVNVEESVSLALS